MQRFEKHLQRVQKATTEEEAQKALTSKKGFQYPPFFGRVRKVDNTNTDIHFAEVMSEDEWRDGGFYMLTKDWHHAKLAAIAEDAIDRKVVKQTVMTTVYGVTFIGAKLQILRRLEELLEKKRIND